MEKEKKNLAKKEVTNTNDLCKNCAIPYISICCICRGKNQWLVNQVLREMTESGIPLFGI